MTLTLIMASLLKHPHDRLRLLDCAMRRAVRNIDAGKLDRALRVIAVARVELGSMIREGEQVLANQRIEPEPCEIEL
jgi:hypothetical protein